MMNWKHPQLRTTGQVLYDKFKSLPIVWLEHLSELLAFAQASSSRQPVWELLVICHFISKPSSKQLQA